MIYFTIIKNYGSHYIKKTKKNHAIIVCINNYKPAKSNNL